MTDIKDAAADLRALAADVIVWVREPKGGTVALAETTLTTLHYQLTAIANRLDPSPTPGEAVGAETDRGGNG